MVAFTDDDCRPAPEWLDRLLAAGAAGGDRPGADRARSCRARRPARLRADDAGHRARPVGAHLQHRLSPRAARAGRRLRRALPRRLGEDTDLALRALDAGASRAYEPGALVHHAVHRRSLLRALREAAGRSNIHLVIARHPRAAARALPGPVREPHPRLLLAAAAGVWLLRRRRLLRFAGAAPYLCAYFDRGAGWTPARAARWALISVPRRVPVDAAELAAMAISSARFRVLVL